MYSAIRAFFALALGVLAAVSWGCEPENDNVVECVAGDCETSCQAKGFASGQCADEASCLCDGTDVGAYPWETSPPDTNPNPDAGADAG